MAGLDFLDSRWACHVALPALLEQFWKGLKAGGHELVISAPGYEMERTVIHEQHERCWGDTDLTPAGLSHHRT